MRCAHRNPVLLGELLVCRKLRAGRQVSRRDLCPQFRGDALIGRVAALQSWVRFALGSGG